MMLHCSLPSVPFANRYHTSMLPDLTSASGEYHGGHSPIESELLPSAVSVWALL